MTLTAEEIQNVAEYQVCGVLHELTCPVCTETLAVDASGLRCPRCRFHQDWVPNYIREGTWRRWVAHLQASDAGPYLMHP